MFSGTDNSVPPAKNIDASATFNGCKTAHYQLDGILRRSFVSSANGGTTTTTGSGDLSLKVLADGRSGTCHQDFSLTVAPDGITATGSICGVDATAALK